MPAVGRAQAVSVKTRVAGVMRVVCNSFVFIVLPRISVIPTILVFYQRQSITISIHTRYRYRRPPPSFGQLSGYSLNSGRRGGQSRPSSGSHRLAEASPRRFTADFVTIIKIIIGRRGVKFFCENFRTGRPMGSKPAPGGVILCANPQWRTSYAL